MATIGLLHPGAMGSVVGGLLVRAGHDVRWVSEGRTQASKDRAVEHGLKDTVSLQALVDISDALLVICPPDAAADLAEEVAGLGFKGLYVDANAVSPSTAERIAETITSVRGADVVDGSLIGPPPTQGGTTRLYLSGGRADEVAGWFRGGSLEPVVAGDEVGAASAVKAAYAGWTKGSAALLLSVRAYARAMGVEQALLDEWGRSIPDARDDSAAIAQRIHRKAWRFEGEMRELAQALDDAGLPDGFHRAAAEVFGRLAELKDRDEDQPVGEVLDRIIGDG